MADEVFLVDLQFLGHNDVDLAAEGHALLGENHDSERGLLVLDSGGVRVDDRGVVLESCSMGRPVSARILTYRWRAGLRTPGRTKLPTGRETCASRTVVPVWRRY